MSMSLYAHGDHATVNAACDSERRRLPRGLRLSPCSPSLPLFMCNQSFLFRFRCCFRVCVKLRACLCCARAHPSAALRCPSIQPHWAGTTDDKRQTQQPRSPRASQRTRTERTHTEETDTKGNDSNKLDQWSVTATAADGRPLGE